MGVRFQECGIDRRRLPLFPGLEFHGESETADLPLQGLAVDAEGEAGVGGEQRKIEIYAEAVEAVEDAQRRSAIECQQTGDPVPRLGTT
jgi:hypothetical protein